MSNNNRELDGQVLEWYNNFVDYVMEYNINMYNSACEYADEKEKENEG